MCTIDIARSNRLSVCVHVPSVCIDCGNQLLTTNHLALVDIAEVEAVFSEWCAPLAILKLYKTGFGNPCKKLGTLGPSDLTL